MADRNTNWDRERDNERNNERGFERNEGREDERRRYSPRGDYGPSAFNHGAGQDN